MTHAAKLVWNEDNWVKPSGLAQVGVPVPATEPYKYGLEEWLNNETLRKHKIGYLDCYRSDKREGIADIMLFTLNPNDRNVYHVGNVCGVKQQLNTPANISAIKAILPEDWLKKPIEVDFVRIEGNIPSLGMPVYKENNWNTTNIISTPPTGFMANIKYEKLEIFDKSKWVNLTEMDSSINAKWRKLGIRYINANANFNDKLMSYIKKVRC